MILHLEQSEIDKAIQLCDEFERTSTKRSTVNGPDASRSDELKRIYAQGPSPFANYLLSLGEPKLIELAALMYYGRGKPVSFTAFNEALEHCSAMSASERHSNLVNKSPIFSQCIKTGLQHLKAEGHSLGGM